mgnify:CR=1 FL=1
MSWALITGASSGIGLRYARALARDYHYNICLVSNQENELKEAAKQISEDYAVRTVLDECVLVPIKGSCDNSSGFLALNETAKIVIDSIVDGKGVDEIADAICVVYEITPETAKADALKLIEDFKNIGVIIEE